jgi:RNA polymerase sigma-70 factor (ECF subfamily)
VEDAIRTLPEHQRRVTEMSIVEGRSPQEIEQETGFSAVNVRVLLSRGKRKLQQLLRR